MQAHGRLWGAGGWWEAAGAGDACDPAQVWCLRLWRLPSAVGPRAAVFPFFLIVQEIDQELNRIQKKKILHNTAFAK